MRWKKLPDGRSCLPEGTIIKFEQRGCYRILGEPAGYGGAGIIYPAVHVVQKDGGWVEDPMQVALKECYPVAFGEVLERHEDGSLGDFAYTDAYSHAKKMMLREKEVTGKVYRKGFRLTPVWDVLEEEEISIGGGAFCPAQNYYALMERLDEKGISLGQALSRDGEGRIGAYGIICVIEQVLRALGEVHSAGYLHGDIQENNLFLKGDLSGSGEPGFVSLIDFGSARELQEDGATAVISGRELYSTRGYSAPECALAPGGELRLTKAADIYSVGYLMLRLLRGRAMEPKALQLVTDGKYLYQRQAKLIGCPLGSIDAVNRILEKALRQDPAARYQDAAQMLAEIERLKVSLAPKKSAIASVDYDAFISYCHEEKSTRAAQRIQRMIEGYRIPREIQRQSGKKKMKKVFRDRDELPSSSDMEIHLREALDHSDFLIVLLSPGAPGSPWVAREIELFLKTHDREHILTVLVEGEPEEVFPEILKKEERYLVSGQGRIRTQAEPVESLAADIRAEHGREQKKKLKTEIFRLLAPMLGCGFDDLRQRQREYRLRRTVRLAGAAAFAFAVVAACIGRQAYLVRENYWQAMIQRARYLAQVSGELLSLGDRVRAVQVAMEALPAGEDDRSRPLVAEAEAALADALYVYKGSQDISHYLGADCLFQMDAKSAGGETLSPDGSLLLTRDEEGTVYVWEGQECLRKWDRRFREEKGIAGEIVYSDFLDDDTVLLMTEHALVRIGIGGQEAKLLAEFDRDYPGDSVCALSRDRGRLAVYDGYETLRVFGLDDGEAIYSEPVSGRFLETGSWLECRRIVFGGDGRYVCAAFGTFLEDHAFNGLLAVLDLEEKTCRMVESRDTAYQDVCFTEDGKLAAFGYCGEGPYGYLESSFPCKVEKYDPDGQRLWEKTADLRIQKGSAPGLAASGSELLLWCSREIRLFDADSGEPLWETVCEAEIAGMLPLAPAFGSCDFLLAARDGRVYLLGTKDRVLRPAGTNVRRSTDRILLACGKGEQRLYLVSDEGETAVLADRKNEPSWQTDAGQTIYQTCFSEQSPYFFLNTAGDSGREIVFFEKDTRRQAGALKLAGFLGGYSLYGDILYFLEYYEDSRGRIAAYDIPGQTFLWETELGDSDYTKVQFCDVAGGEPVILKHEAVDGKLYSIRLESGRWREEADTARGDALSDEEVHLSFDGRFLVLLQSVREQEEDAFFGCRQVLRVYDREQGCWVGLPGAFEELELNGYGIADDLVFLAGQRNLAAVYEKRRNRMKILDLDRMEVVQEIPCHALNQREAAFTADGTGLLLWGDDGLLKFWDLRDGVLVMEDRQKLYYVRDIAVYGQDGFVEIEGFDEEEASFNTGFTVNRWLYFLDEDGNFCPVTSLASGFYNEVTDEVWCADGNRQLCYPHYGLDELLSMARGITGGKELSGADKLKYYIPFEKAPLLNAAVPDDTEGKVLQYTE